MLAAEMLVRSMIALVRRAWSLRYFRQKPRVPHDFGRLQGTAVAHVEAFGPTFDHALQLAGYGLRVIFERRTDRVTGEGDASDQDARCDQIADQGVMR